MTSSFGTLYLVPNTLDFGMDGTLPGLEQTLAPAVIRLASRLNHWVVENAKSARAFLKRVDAIAALDRPVQELSIVEMPRPAKGKNRAETVDLLALLAPALAGHDLGLLSEAGLPAVADPGAAFVRIRCAPWDPGPRRPGHDARGRRGKHPLLVIGERAG